MKIFNPVLLLSCLFTITISAQEISDNALGLRLGDSDGFGAEISYQRLLSRYHRLELNLGWRDSSCLLYTSDAADEYNPV